MKIEKDRANHVLTIATKMKINIEKKNNDIRDFSYILDDWANSINECETRIANVTKIKN